MSRIFDGIKQGSYASVIYDNDWFIGYITEVDNANDDAKVKLMHLKGPSVSFRFPEYEDVCWVPYAHILCIVEPPTLATLRGQYKLSNGTLQQIQSAFAKFLHTPKCTEKTSSA